MKNAMVVAAKVLGYIVLAVLLLGLVYLFASMTNGFGGRVQGLVLSVNGQDVREDMHGLVVQPDEEGLDIGVGSIFLDVNRFFADAAAGQETDYAVRVLRNEAVDFMVLPGQSPVYFSDADYTKFFEIEKRERGFTIRPTMYFGEMLADLYPGEKVRRDVVPDMFLLEVTSASGDVVRVFFSVGDNVSGVELDEEVLVF